MGLNVYINGEFFEKGQACISVYDHGLLYGDGVFEGIRAYNGRIFRRHEHVGRLFRSAEAIALQIPLSPEQISQDMYRTLELNGLRDAYIRLLVTRGIGLLGIDPSKCAGPQVVIIADSIELYPQELYENGLKLIITKTVRTPRYSFDTRVKSLNYLNNIIAKIECLRAGVMEGIMLNTDGKVAECTGDNIFIVKGSQLATPPVSACILEGVTRKVVMDLAPEAGLEAVERDMVPEDLYAADECFLTGTAAEIVPVVGIDDRQIGDGRPGAHTATLLSMFREETEKDPG